MNCLLLTVVACSSLPKDVETPSAEGENRTTFALNGKKVSAFISARDTRDELFDIKSDAELFLYKRALTDEALAALPADRRERIRSATPELDTATGLPKVFVNQSEPSFKVYDARGELTYAQHLAELHPEEIARLEPWIK